MCEEEKSAFIEKENSYTIIFYNKLNMVKMPDDPSHWVDAHVWHARSEWTWRA